MNKKAIFFMSAAVMAVVSCNNYDQEYRNVALMKAASQSSAWDLNQTAQLVTDGLPATGPAPWVDVRLSGKEVSVLERNYLTDLNVSRLEIPGEEATLAPGESKSVDVSFESIQGKPVFELEGMNIGLFD